MAPNSRPILGGAFHEPFPLIPSFSPSGGEGARRAVEGDSDRFMASIHVRILEVPPPHEPPPPIPPPRGGGEGARRAGEGEVQGFHGRIRSGKSLPEGEGQGEGERNGAAPQFSRVFGK